MLDYTDQRWNRLRSGYRLPYSPVAALQKLEVAPSNSEAWKELWEELFHQNDVDTASYAAVPHIVRIYAAQSVFDWNPYALVATIELARGEGTNPDVPDFLSHAYFQAIDTLAERATSDIAEGTDDCEFSSVAAVIALRCGFRRWAHLLATYTEDEIYELINDSNC